MSSKTLSALLGAVVSLLLIVVLAPSPAQAGSGGVSQVEGIQPVASSATGIRPVVVGGTDGSLVRPESFDPSSLCQFVSLGINAALEIPKATGVLTSNGVTAVRIGPAASSGKNVFLVKLCVYNTSTTTLHTFTLEDSSGVVLFQCQLNPGSASSAGGSAFLDSDHGSYVTQATNRSLQFVEDAGGSPGDLTLTATTVQK